MKKLLAMLLGATLALMIGTGSVAAAQPTTGTGGLDFEPSLVPAESDGVEGRIVFLTGAIEGENFEPGDCEPFPSSVGGVGGKCLIFTKSEPAPDSGQFQRAHEGQAAFTICDPCTLIDPETGEARTGSFTLKISYPNPNDLTFTKFTIQDASGELEGLRGHGTLDFIHGTYTIAYHFSGRPASTTTQEHENDKVNVHHNGRTISVSRNALDAHLGHGDSEGTYGPDQDKEQDHGEKRAAQEAKEAKQADRPETQRADEAKQENKQQEAKQQAEKQEAKQQAEKQEARQGGQGSDQAGQNRGRGNGR